MAQTDDEEQAKAAFYQWLESNHLQQLHKSLQNNGYEYLTDFDEMSEQEATKLCEMLQIGKAGIKRRLIKAIEHYNNGNKVNNNGNKVNNNGNKVNINNNGNKVNNNGNKGNNNGSNNVIFIINSGDSDEKDEKDAFEYSVKFTHLNGVGRHGPTKLDDYKGKAHFKDTILMGGIQRWKVPKTGYYYIVACGARGGESESNHRHDREKGRFDGGSGAMVGGTVKLNANDKVKILVGQQGEDSIPHDDKDGGYGGGGGGGTFVVLIKKGEPLFIAAGGSGAYGSKFTNASNGIDGQAKYSESRDADNKKFGGYECDGWGARGASYTNDFKTFRSGHHKDMDGRYHDYNKRNGKSFIDGGLGGQYGGDDGYGADGGFGGGGGSYAAGGGGGGYIGALVLWNPNEVAFWRQGALSFNCCDNKAYRIMKSGENYGHGYVEVKYIGVSE